MWETINRYQQLESLLKYLIYSLFHLDFLLVLLIAFNSLLILTVDIKKTINNYYVNFGDY